MQLALARPLERYAPLWPLVGHALTVIGVAYVVLALTGQAGIGGCGGTIVACDAAAYYYTTPSLYEIHPLAPPYLYSPAFAWAMAPFRLLPFDAFVWVWAGLHVAALVWLRAGWMLAIPGVNEDVIRGNVGTFLAILVVLGVRYGAPWAAVLLTKVVPGIGLVWHVARGEWRQVAWAVGLAAGIALVGWIVAPDLWVDWFRHLYGAPGDSSRGSWPVRLVLAVGVIIYAARTDRAWLLPVALVLGTRWISPPALIVLAAVPRLMQWRASR